MEGKAEEEAAPDQQPRTNEVVPRPTPTPINAEPVSKKESGDEGRWVRIVALAAPRYLPAPVFMETCSGIFGEQAFVEISDVEYVSLINRRVIAIRDELGDESKKDVEAVRLDLAFRPTTFGHSCHSHLWMEL